MAVRSEDPTASALPKRLSYPEPWQLNGSKTSSADTQKSSTPVYATQQPLYKGHGILSIPLQVAIKDTSVQDKKIKH